MKLILRALFFLGVLTLAPTLSHAQAVSAYSVSACGGQSLAAGGFFPLTMDLTGKLCDSGGGSTTVVGNISNGSDAVAPTSTNLGTTSYNYGWNGTGWDRLQVDGSKNLKTTITGPLGAAVALPTTPVSVVEPDDFNICTGSNTCTASGATTLFCQDTIGYSSVGTTVTANAGPNTITFEMTDDPLGCSSTTWVPAYVVPSNNTGTSAGTPATSTASLITFTWTKRAEFFRARVSTQVGGATTVFAREHKNSAQNTNSGTGILAPVGSQTPANSVATVSAGYTYGHITTATTTTLKSGAGVVHTICVNSLGTVASSLTVDDATSATTPTIAVINSLTLLGCQTFDVAFATGLTIVSTGTVAPDVTVSYR
jgi:hypothetical protein